MEPGIVHLWQKPYGKVCSFSLISGEIGSEGRIFCPFMHNAREEPSEAYREIMTLDRIDSESVEQLRAYHLAHGYTYRTSTSLIMSYLKMFRDLRIDEVIHVYKKSFYATRDSLTGSVYVVKVKGDPVYGVVGGFHGVFRSVETLGERIVTNSRYSMSRHSGLWKRKN